MQSVGGEAWRSESDRGRERDAALAVASVLSMLRRGGRPKALMSMVSRRCEFVLVDDEERRSACRVQKRGREGTKMTGKIMLMLGGPRQVYTRKPTSNYGAR